MAFTFVTLVVVFSMTGLFLSLLVGSLGGKAENLMVVSLIIFGIAIPLILSIFFGFLIPFVSLDDWPMLSYPMPPQSAIFIGCWVGGFLGMKAGRIWNVDNDRSCFQCLLVPISLITIGSLLVLFFL